MIREPTGDSKLAVFLKRVVQEINSVTLINVIGGRLTRTPSGTTLVVDFPKTLPFDSQFFIAKITDVDDLASNYVTVRRVDSAGDSVGSDILVAIPHWLRTAPTTPEEWPHAAPAVAPAYTEGDYLVVAQVNYTGVEVDDVDVGYIDLNIPPRIWSVTLDYCYGVEETVFRVPVALTGNIGLA
jgi:hypothetical protein